MICAIPEPIRTMRIAFTFFHFIFHARLFFFSNLLLCFNFNAIELMWGLHTFPCFTVCVRLNALLRTCVLPSI